MERKNTGSYLALIGSMLIFGTIGIFRELIPISSALLACFRGFLGAASLILFVVIKGGKLRHGIGKKNFWLLVLTGALVSELNLKKA